VQAPDEVIESLNKDMLRLKAYFPYRIVWACWCPVTGEHYATATTTKHKLNNLLKKGWHCYALS